MKSVLADGRNPFSWMKSLCDEIRLCGEKGTDFFSSTNVDLICQADFILAWARISLYDTYEVMIVTENKLADLSMDFAVKILKLTDEMQGHYALKNQLERSATSIGANIREAKYAHSKADFIAKLQISLKECFETEYWLELMVKADILSPETGKTLLHECGVMRRMLIASINTAKENHSR